MARRRKHKRLNCCAKCAIALAIIFILNICALYGGGMFAWSKFVQPKTNITFNQGLSLAMGLYQGKESKVVTQKHTTSDLDAFYDNLSETLFLDESVDLKSNFSEVILSLMSKKEETQERDTSVETMAVVEETAPNATEEETTKSITGNETLDKFLRDIKFDFSRLKEYDEEHATPNVLSLTGKQLGAFLDKSVSEILKGDSIKEKIPEAVGPFNLKNIDISKTVRIPQLIIANEEIKGINKISLKLTVALEFRDAAKQLLSEINPSLGFLSFLIPKQLFVSCKIFPNDSSEPAQIDINGFDEKRQESLTKLLDAVLKTSSYQSFENLMKTINQSVIESIENVQNVVPIYFVAEEKEASLQTRPITVLMNTMGITELTEVQFFCLIRDLKLQEFDDVKGTIFPSPLDKDITRADVGDKIDDDMTLLIESIEEKYAVEKNYLKKDTLYKQLTKVDSDVPGEDCLKYHIRTEQLVFDNQNYIDAAHKLNVSYRAFAGLMNSYLLENPMSNEGGLNFSFEILNMMYDMETNTIGIAAEIGLRESLMSSFGDNDSIAADLIPQLIPDYMYAMVYVKLDDTFTTAIAINGKSVEQTIEHLDTISKICNSLGINADNLSYVTLTDKIKTAVTDGFGKVEEELGSIGFEESHAVFPSIYEVLGKVVLHQEGVTDLSATQVYNIIYGLMVMEEGYENSNLINANIGDFLTQINTKYSITAPASQIKDPNAPGNEEVGTITAQLTNLAGNYNSAIDGADLTGKWASSTKDGEAIQTLKPYANEGTMGQIFASVIDLSTIGQGLKNVTLHNVTIVDANTMQIVFKAEAQIPEGSETYIQNLVPDLYIYVDIKMDKIASTTEDCCDISINNLSGDDLVNFTDMIQRLTGNEMNLDNIKSTCSDKIKLGLGSLLEKVEISLVPKAGEQEARFYISSIFEVARNAVAQEGDTFSAIDLANTLCLLHNTLTRQATNTPDNTEVSANFNFVNQSIDATLSAQQLIHKINTNAKTSIATSLGTSESALTVYQAALIDMSTDNLKSNRDALTSSINYQWGNTNTNKYLITSLAIDTTAIGGEGGFKSTLLPETMHVSAIVNLSSATGETIILYNGLCSAEETSVGILNRLTGNNDQFNLTTLTTSIQTTMLDMTIFSYEEISIPGVGTLPAGEIKLSQILAQPNAGTIEHTLDTSNYIAGKYVISYNPLTT